MMDYTKWANDIHDWNVNVGWWDGWAVKTDRHCTSMMLVLTELAEAAEGVRKNLMDDHLPEYPMLHVELADALIRLLDCAGAYEMDLSADPMLPALIEAYRVDIDLSRNDMERLYRVSKCVCIPSTNVGGQIIHGVASLMAFAQYLELDIEPIVAAKVEYNKHRADHKREARNKPGGKTL